MAGWGKKGRRWGEKRQAGDAQRQFMVNLEGKLLGVVEREPSGTIRLIVTRRMVPLHWAATFGPVPREGAGGEQA